MCAAAAPAFFLHAALQVRIVNVTASYDNPSDKDTCEQYNSKAAFALRQTYNVSLLNVTTFNIAGPVTIPIKVFNGSTNAICKLGMPTGGTSGCSAVDSAACV